MISWAAMPLGRFRLGSGISSATADGFSGLVIGMNVPAWRTLLTVSAAVRGTDGKGSVQHAEAENKPITRIPGLIVPSLPDKLMGGVAILRRWHYGDNHKTDEPYHQACEREGVGEICEDGLAKEDQSARCPRHA